MLRVFSQGAPLLTDWATRPWIAAWREDWLPDLQRTVAAAVERLDDTRKPSTVPESIAMIDELLRATGRYFVAIALVAGVGYKSEVPLARFYARHVRRRTGGSHQELLVGPGALETVRAHAVTSLDWGHPILDAGAIAQALQVAEQRREGLDRRRGEAEAQALGSLKGQRRRRLVRLIETAQRFARMREEVVASLTLGYPMLRRALLGIGRSLVERRLLRDEADVMFLGRGDLDAAIAGATAAADLARVAEANRRLVAATTSQRAAGARHDPAYLDDLPADESQGHGRDGVSGGGNGNACGSGHSGEPGDGHGPGAHRAGSGGVHPRRRGGRADRPGDGTGVDRAVRARRRSRHRHR